MTVVCDWRIRTIFDIVPLDVGLGMDSKDLKIPVYSTADATNLQSLPDGALLPALVQMQCVQAVDWTKLCTQVLTPTAFTAAPVGREMKVTDSKSAAPAPIMKRDVTHVLDFGPGSTSGTARLTQMMCEGSGLVVVVCGAVSTKVTDSPMLVSKRALLDKLQTEPVTPVSHPA
jgi:malonyl CoA-acyl carrier protein transacylase